MIFYIRLTRSAWRWKPRGWKIKKTLRLDWLGIDIYAEVMPYLQPKNPAAGE